MTDLMVRDGRSGRPATPAARAGSSESTRRIELVVTSLQSRFGATVAPERIRAEVEAGFAEYATARVQDFVPILVEARVRSRLGRRPAP